MAPKGSTLTPAQARLRQQYQNWLKWWRSTISCDDYLKFVAQKVTKTPTGSSALQIYALTVTLLPCLAFHT